VPPRQCGAAQLPALLDVTERRRYGRGDLRQAVFNKAPHPGHAPGAGHGADRSR